MTNTTLDALDNITRLALQADEYRVRAEAAEADARLWMLRTDEAAAVVGKLEDEVERLRAALAASQASEQYVRGEMARLQRLVARASHGQE